MRNTEWLKSFIKTTELNYNFENSSEFEHQMLFFDHSRTKQK